MIHDYGSSAHHLKQSHTLVMTIKFIHTFLLLAFLTHVESFTIRSTTTRLGASEAPTLPLTTALSPNTFAGRVEQGILQRFGTDAQRIVAIIVGWILRAIQKLKGYRNVNHQ